MSAVIAVAAALGLVGVGMLVSPDAGRLRSFLKRRRRKAESEPATLPGSVAEPLERPPLRVIHGDGGTVVPFRPRRADTFASSPPPNPRGEGPDAA